MPPIIPTTMSMSGRVTRPMASVGTSSAGTGAAPGLAASRLAAPPEGAPDQPPKPRAASPRAAGAGRDRRIARGVSLRRGAIEVVAKRRVRGRQQRAAAGDIVRLQQADGGQ